MICTQVCTLLSRKTGNRPWTLYLDPGSILFNAHRQPAHTGSQLLECMPQPPMLTAHTIIMDFEDNGSLAAVKSMAALLGGILFPHLRQLEIRTHELHESRTADQQWLYMGQALAAMPAEQRASIHTLRIVGLKLPNPALSSVLAHLPNVRTLRMPWTWVNKLNYVSIGLLTVMWQQLRYIEDFTEINVTPSMLRAIRMPSVTHVSLVDGESVPLEQLTALFPGVQHISGGNVRVKANRLPTRVPDCTTLYLHVDDTLPSAQMLLTAGAMPSTHTGIVSAYLSEECSVERVRNLLMQLLATAPNMRSVRMWITSTLQTAASILHALVGSRRLGSIFMQLLMSAANRAECKQQLDAALQQSFSLVGDDRLELVVGDCLIEVFFSVCRVPSPHDGASL